jgi:GTP-binding protein Era
MEFYMVHVTFDPEAGSLYWYFSEIEEGSSVEEVECDGTLWLDGDGEVVGLEIELDESVNRRMLSFALAHPQVRFDTTTYTLTIAFFDQEPEGFQPLHEPIILDLDDEGRIQGCEVVAAKTFGLGKRLTRLAPFTLALEEDTFVPPGYALSAQADAVEPTDAADADPADELEQLDQLEGQVDPDDLADLDQLDSDQEEEDDDEDEDEDEDEPIALSGIIAGGSVTTANPAGFRSGFVALVGPPNAGKSTLLNALLGQKVAIVSPRPQTTRTAIRGILNRPDAQIIFVDTPGIHQPRTRLGNYMVEQARRAIPDSDVVCMVVDITRPPGRLDQRIAEIVRRSRSPKLLVLNKVDERNPHSPEHVQAYRELATWDMELAISALRRLGLETLLDEIVSRLPTERALYPEDQVTDQSEREIASELVREQILRMTKQEVPHGVAVEVEEWEQRDRAIYMRLSIYVEKDSQKGILIGAGGQMLKQIGSNARKQIERTLGQTIFLDLWVKTRENWRDDPNALHWFGYKNQK